MSTTSDNTTPHNIPTDMLLAHAVRSIRGHHGLGVRELSRAAGVAAPQISRLEKGEVRKPAADTLIALARALGENPIPLLVMAGYIEGEAARARLRAFFAEGIEFEEEWTFRRGAESLQSTRSLLADSSTSDEQLRRLAFEVSMMGETAETLWDDAYLALGAQGAGSRQLQELVSLWPSLTEERRQRALADMRDHAELSRAEFANEMAELQRQDELAAAEREVSR